MVRIYVFWLHNLFQTSSHPKLIVYHDSSNFASFLYDFYEVFSSETYCLMLETWSTLSLGYESKYQFYMFIKFIFIV